MEAARVAREAESLLNEQEIKKNSRDHGETPINSDVAFDDTRENSQNQAHFVPLAAKEPEQTPLESARDGSPKPPRPFGCPSPPRTV